MNQSNDKWWDEPQALVALPASISGHYIPTYHIDINKYNNILLYKQQIYYQITQLCTDQIQSSTPTYCNYDKYNWCDNYEKYWSYVGELPPHVNPKHKILEQINHQCTYISHVCVWLRLRLGVCLWSLSPSPSLHVLSCQDHLEEALGCRLPYK